MVFLFAIEFWHDSTIINERNADNINLYYLTINADDAISVNYYSSILYLIITHLNSIVQEHKLYVLVVNCDRGCN